MHWIAHLLSAAHWATGNGAYMRLTESMGNDYFWTTLAITLNLALAAGCIVICCRGNDNRARAALDAPADRELRSMRNLLLGVGLCGYLFIPITLFWPAWRVYDLVMIALVFSTWHYAFNAHELRAIHGELEKSASLTKALEESHAATRQKSTLLNALNQDLRPPLNDLALQARRAAASLQAGDHAALTQAIQDIQISARTAADALDQLLTMTGSNADSLHLNTPSAALTPPKRP